MLHIKQLNSKKTSFPRFDKNLVIQPIADVYAEGNERQLCYRRFLKFVKQRIQNDSTFTCAKESLKEERFLFTTYKHISRSAIHIIIKITFFL